MNFWRAVGLIGLSVAFTVSASAQSPTADVVARDLQKKLGEVEKKLWVTPDTKGLVLDETALRSSEHAGELVGPARSPGIGEDAREPDRFRAEIRLGWAGQAGVVEEVDDGQHGA